MSYSKSSFSFCLSELIKMNSCTKFDKNIKDTVKDLKENCEKCIKEHKICYYEISAELELKRIFIAISRQISQDSRKEKIDNMLYELSFKTKEQKC